MEIYDDILHKFLTWYCQNIKTFFVLEATISKHTKNKADREDSAHAKRYRTNDDDDDGSFDGGSSSSYHKNSLPFYVKHKMLMLNQTNFKIKQWLIDIVLKDVSQTMTIRKW